MKEWRKPEYLEKTPDDELQKCGYLAHKHISQVDNTHLWFRSFKASWFWQKARGSMPVNILNLNAFWNLP